MMKKIACLSIAAALAASLAGCSTSQTQQFASNAANTVSAINTVNNALIQLNSTVINNTAQLAAALAKVECPIVNASVSLGSAIAADPNVASNVKSALTKAGSAGALASDICNAAGYGPTVAAASVTAQVAVTPTAQ